MDILKNNYEKMILATLLLFFVGSLFWLITILTANKTLSGDINNIKNRNATYQQKDYKNEHFTIEDNLINPFKWNKNQKRENLSSDFSDWTDLMIPIVASFSPYNGKLIPRKECFEDKKICSFSGKKLSNPKDKAEIVLDTDGDGISDDIEIKYGLNPEVADANDDLDGDELSNIDEIIKYETDPTDAKSRLHFAAKLRLKSVERTELDIKLVKINPTGTDKKNWLIQVEVLKYNKFNKSSKIKSAYLTLNKEFYIGETDKYIVTDINVKKEMVYNDKLKAELEKNISSMTIKRVGDDKLIYVKQDAIVYDPIVLTEFEDIFSGNVGFIKKGELFKVGTEKTGFDEFEFVSIAGDANAEQILFKGISKRVKGKSFNVTRTDSLEIK